MELRNYQKAAINQIQQSFAEGHQGVFLQIPTGGGKTPTFCGLIQAEQASNANIKTLVIAHRTELLDQTSEKLNRFEVPHGIVQGSRNTNPEATVQVCSIQTIDHQELPFKPDLIVVDEAHRAVAESYQTILRQAPNARRLLTSATPKRTDGQGFLDVASKLIIGATIKQLIKDGHLVLPSHVSSFGDPVEVYKIHSKGKKTLIFAISVEHCQILKQKFRDMGISSEVLFAETKSEQRRDILQRFKTGQIQVLINYDVLGEGFDEPSLETVILCRNLTSETLYLQQAGRVLRPFGNKETGLILDLNGNVKRFGPVDKARKWTLEGQEKPYLFKSIIKAAKEARVSLEIMKIRGIYWGHFNDARRQFRKSDGKPYNALPYAWNKTRDEGYEDVQIIAALWDKEEPYVPWLVTKEFEYVADC